jgi:hypothetical protein
VARRGRHPHPASTTATCRHRPTGNCSCLEPPRRALYEEDDDDMSRLVGLARASGRECSGVEWSELSLGVCVVDWDGRRAGRIYVHAISNEIQGVRLIKWAHVTPPSSSRSPEGLLRLWREC